MIVTAPVLAYYDANKPVVIQCDASQCRLGVALLQEERPVAYSSRVMTQTEQIYAQSGSAACNSFCMSEI